MRIALLTSEYSPFAGGVATYARELAAAADAAGHDVTVLAPDYGADQSIVDDGLPGRTVRFSGGAANMRGLPARIAATRTLLARESFDIVHAADWPFFIPLRLSLGKAREARFLLTVHGSEIIYMRAAKRRLPLSAIGFWQPGWTRWIANSCYTRELLLREFPMVSPENVRAVPLGVSSEWSAGRVARAEARQRLGVADDTIVIVSLGRVVPRKGHTVLANAIALLPKVMQSRLTWWIIGPELELEYAVELRSRTASLRVRTEHLGGVAADEVRLRLSAADLFCLPGYQDEGGRIEGFGLVFLEAGAYGVPSIATRSGGIPEAVEHGESGLLVPERDPVALAGALMRVIDDAAFRSRLSSGAEAKAKDATWAAVTARTYE